ncbi:hypothetical protein CPC08DRAFT_771543 [Agrocybe pediades]|nr:hypothetical protein CPC08DRAFT_771543 [Agrocybe pediades]
MQPKDTMPYILTVDIRFPSNAFPASLNSILHPTSLALLASQARPESPDPIFNCIAHDPQNAFRLVDHEPAADDGDTSFLEKLRTLWLTNRFKWGRSTE